MPLFRDVRSQLTLLYEEFRNFRDHLIRFGFEYFFRFYGPYRGLVVDNKDPAGLGRVKVQCPRAGIPPDNDHWFWPMMDGAGKGHGAFFPPEPGDGVWVFFDNGSPDQPQCYLGGWYFGKELDESIRPEPGNAPKKRGFITPGGNRLVFDDTNGSEAITIEQKNGKTITIKESKISVGSKDGSFEPMVLGSTLKNWLDNHTHSHAYGPTLAPLQPLPDSALSKDTETS